MALTLNNVPQQQPQGLTLSNVPQTATAMPAQPMPAQPMPAQGGLTLASTRPDPGFNINTATNTFYKTLGERVASGQMTMDQARAAQAEMRALQLNPAMANRAAATEIAQRNLQVGPYAPQPVTAPALSYPMLGNTPPQPKMVQPPMPQAPTEVIGARMPPPGVRGGDTRIFADQPMAYPGGDPNFDESTGVYTPDARGITSILGRFFDKGIGNDPMQPRFIGKHFTGDAPEPGMTYIETGEGLVPVPINDMPMRPSTGPGLGGGIGAFLGRPGQVPQGAGMPPGMGVLRERIGNMLNPPRQSGFVDTMPLINPDPNFRVGQTPQQMAPNAQGMAMGGLMRKYGGMC